MITNNILKKFYNRGWILPLLLPLLLLHVSIGLSVKLFLPQGFTYLIYLPLAAMVALLIVYDWAAFPGILLAIFGYYCRHDSYNFEMACMMTGIFMATLGISWAGYKLHTHRRWNVDFSEPRLIPARLFWLVFMVPTLYTLGMQLITVTGFVSVERTLLNRRLFSLYTLLNYQSVLLSCMVMIPVYYLVIRILRNPMFIRLLYLRARRQAAQEVKKHEFVIWSSLLLFLMIMLLVFQKGKENLLTTDYGLPLLLPLMLWSAMRFGYIFTSLSWAILLVLLYQLRDRFLTVATDPYSLAVMSANMLVFTLTIMLMASISTRQRFAMKRIKQAALCDPLNGLANLRALEHDLAAQSRSTLCFLRIPDLDRLSCVYGLQMRINYMRSLANYLMAERYPGERIYQLPGFDLVLRLNYVGHEERIENIEARLKDYQLIWEGMPVYTVVGISYCHVRSPVSYLCELLGEMSAQAERSIHSGVAENFQQNKGKSIQHSLTEKISLLEDVQLMLKSGSIELMAQQVSGIRGDAWYEITLHMRDRNGEAVSAACFSAIVNEFGLAWEVDRLIINNVLAFIFAQRQQMPGIRFVLKMFSASLARPRLVKEIGHYLSQYDVEPWQLIIQVDESSEQTHYSGVSRSLAQLRHIGLQVVIDDFGSARSSYMRLKEVQADMLKIDGELVRNMRNSSLDYQLVESICAIAKLKRMRIIAKCVECEETAQQLRHLGVDFLQGDLIAKPCHLALLVPANEKIAGASTA